jgi:hypothetical protein
MGHASQPVSHSPTTRMYLLVSLKGVLRALRLLLFTEAAKSKVVSVPKHHSGKFCGAVIGIILIALGSATLIV